MSRSGETYDLPACTWKYPLAGDTLDPGGFATLINDVRDAITGSAARAGATFTGSIKVANGATATPQYTFTNQTNTGFWHSGAGATSTATFAANGVDKFRGSAAASSELQVFRSAAWRSVVDSSSTQTLSGTFTYSGVVNLNGGGAMSGLWTGNHDYSGVIEFGGNISVVAATLTSSTATLAGSWAGTPTFSGVPIFSGNVSFTASPAFSVGTPTFANGITVNGGAVAMTSASSVTAVNSAVTTNNNTVCTTSAATTALALKASLTGATFSGAVSGITTLGCTGLATLGGTTRASRTPLCMSIPAAGTTANYSNDGGVTYTHTAASGIYVFTHGLGTANYTIQVTTAEATVRRCNVSSAGATTFQVNTFNSSDVAADVAFFLTATPIA